ncbi:MAG: sortase [Actinomycetota bacterium]|nr:sortase [Actinomycetota bacterium]
MRFIAYVGKFLISVGVGILLFVAWTLWGTGYFYTAHQQHVLAQRWAEIPQYPPPSSRATPGPPPGYCPAHCHPGDAAFRLKIPSINVNFMVIEGVSEQDLRRGPGHYPSCRPGFPPPLCTRFREVWPGETGRIIISGHRTTYLHPFYNLDRMKPGDKIVLETKWGSFIYSLDYERAVAPDTTSIVVPKQSIYQLVLTTCNPKYSASQRLVAFAHLEGTKT